MKALGKMIPDNIRAAMARAGIDEMPPEPETFYICDFCEDMGVIKAAGLEPGHPYYGRLIPCPNPDCPKGNDNRRRIYEARYKTARIPLDFRGLTFQTWDEIADRDKLEKFPAWAASWLFATQPDHYSTRAQIYGLLGLPDPLPHEPDRRKNCVMLFGGVGQGKSGLMYAAANHLIDIGRTPVCIRVVDLIEEIQSRYGADEYPTAKDVIEDFKNAQILFLDEFGVANEKQADRWEKVESIIEFRRAEYKPTFFTTNHTQESFVAAWGQRTADRIKNMAHWLSVGGNKLRQTEAPLPNV